jgi:hypothetical protein
VIARARIGGVASYVSVFDCPSVRECVAVLSNGGLVTFNPRIGRAINSRVIAHPRGGAIGLWQIDCPSASECVALGVGGVEWRLDPETRSPPARARIDIRGASPVALTCPSGVECVAADADGARNERIITFDPYTGAVTQRRKTASDVPIASLDCPAAHVCVGTGIGGYVLTGDPLSSLSARLGGRIGPPSERGSRAVKRWCCRRWWALRAGPGAVFGVV